MNSSISHELRAFLDGPLSLARRDAIIARDLLQKLKGRQESSASSEPSRRQTTFSLESRVPLFDYQQEVVDRLLSLRASKVRSAMVSLPTGGGKTRTGLWLARELMAGGLRRILWLAPSTELLDQAAEAAKELWTCNQPSPSATAVVGTIPISADPRLPCIVFATSQMASKRLPAIQAMRPELLFYDEAHQAAARTSQRILREVIKQTSSFTIGLSATPGRSLNDEGEFLASLFSNQLVVPTRLGKDPVRWLTHAGVLARIEFRRIPLPAQWNDVVVTSRAGNTLSIDALALNSARFWALVECIVQVSSKRRSLVFCASVAHAQALAAAVHANGLSTSILSHKTPLDLRKKVLQRFKAGGLDALFNKSVLAAGFDDPGLEDVVLASPIRSAILWEQIVGRASRGPAVGGTKIARVWELDNHQELHKRVLSAQRYVHDVW